MVSDFSFSVTLSFAFLAIDCDVTLTGGGRKLHESISCVIAISLSWRKQCECVGFWRVLSLWRGDGCSGGWIRCSWRVSTPTSGVCCNWRCSDVYGVGGSWLLPTLLLWALAVVWQARLRHHVSLHDDIRILINLGHEMFTDRFISRSTSLRFSWMCHRSFKTRRSESIIRRMWPTHFPPQGR